jgi:hypothetical protein
LPKPKLIVVSRPPGGARQGWPIVRLDDAEIDAPPRSRGAPDRARAAPGGPDPAIRRKVAMACRLAA